jgi:hypothetical protein
VPIKARYRQTHWVGAHRTPGGRTAIFDINAMNVGSWIDPTDWTDMMVPWILEQCVPRADGNWHITHQISLGRR